MNWKYKNIEISTDGEGKFVFIFNKKSYYSNSLYEAEEKIDSLTKSYYTITENDIKSILEKLDEREGEFVSYMIDELHHHIDSPYCVLGVSCYWYF